ncbi:4'-phosphopantetheinyl transferase family protein [Flavobacterium okayamense]|uniref:4'-phosphopantetheinyl transferase n=1 Tax=Flavobacterium okayamense TaxID=2830782 RepID=A0ABM7S5H6_9FLAO|nr:4'-phosphopantetheinyl transferase superfamily protein [Flavobacterium okayamense]BCY28093.1 4'-phosphopantetheinyl transferase [Flavobacterium okayamense]
MPFHKSIVINNFTTAYFWKITEDFNELFRAVQLKDLSLARLEKMKSESHQKGFLAVRMLLQHLGYSDFDLFYDESGKPHLEKKEEREKKKDLHISISHSFDFSCICISSDKIVGIDIEIIKPKILKIAPRFMDLSHLENLSENDRIEKATVIWGAKESIFKIKNEKGISFPNHIFEAPFFLSDSNCNAELRFNNTIEKFFIQFYKVEEYIFVVALPNK